LEVNVGPTGSVQDDHRLSIVYAPANQGRKAVLPEVGDDTFGPNIRLRFVCQSGEPLGQSALGRLDAWAPLVQRHK